MKVKKQIIRAVFGLVFILIFCNSQLFSARISPLLESVYNAHKSAGADSLYLGEDGIAAIPLSSFQEIMDISERDGEIALHCFYIVKRDLVILRNTVFIPPQDRIRFQQRFLLWIRLIP